MAAAAAAAGSARTARSGGSRRGKPRNSRRAVLATPAIPPRPQSFQTSRGPRGAHTRLLAQEGCPLQHDAVAEPGAGAAGGLVSCPRVGSAGRTGAGGGAGAAGGNPSGFRHPPPSIQRARGVGRRGSRCVGAGQGCGGGLRGRALPSGRSPSGAHRPLVAAPHRCRCAEPAAAGRTLTSKGFSCGKGKHCVVRVRLLEGGGGAGPATSAARPPAADLLPLAPAPCCSTAKGSASRAARAAARRAAAKRGTAKRGARARSASGTATTPTRTRAPPCAARAAPPAS